MAPNRKARFKSTIAICVFLLIICLLPFALVFLNLASSESTQRHLTKLILAPILAVPMLVIWWTSGARTRNFLKRDPGLFMGLGIGILLVLIAVISTWVRIT